MNMPDPEGVNHWDTVRDMRKVGIKPCSKEGSIEEFNLKGCWVHGLTFKKR